MVLPVFDYCDVVWDTLSDSQQYKLEKLQTRAELNIHWPSLVSRRKMHTAILVFKCLSNRVPSFLQNYNIDLSNPGRLTRNCAHKCQIYLKLNWYLAVRAFMLEAHKFLTVCLCVFGKKTFSQTLGREP